MRHTAKSKVLSTFLVVSLMLPTSNVIYGASNSSPNVSATFPDVEEHWAKKVLDDWVGKGWAKGYQDGEFKPDKVITRAEFMALMNQSFGFTDMSDVSFTDLKASHWALNEVKKAVQAGYISGYQDETIRPDQPITRQEAAVIMAKLLRVTSASAGQLTFSDVNKIPAWSKSGIDAMVNYRIMNGYEDHTFKATAPLTRAEAIVTINQARPSYFQVYDQPGTFGPSSGSQTIIGPVVIASEGVILQNVVVEGGLTLKGSVQDGAVSLKNVKVNGNTVIQGNSSPKLKLIHSQLQELVLEQGNKLAHIIAEGSSVIKQVKVQSSAKLEEVNVTDDGFKDVQLTEGLPESSKVTLSGSFEQLGVTVRHIQLLLSSGSIASMKVDKKGEGLQLTLEANTKLAYLALEAAIRAYGEGIIKAAEASQAIKLASSFNKQPEKFVIKDTGGGAPGPSTGGQPSGPSDQDLANRVSTKIEALPELSALTIADAAAVREAEQAFQKLTKGQQERVSKENQQKLADAVAKIAELIAAQEADQKAASAAAALIQKLPELDQLLLEDEAQVLAANEAYLALTDAQKAWVEEPLKKKLQDAMTRIQEIKADQQAADEVSSLIEKLPSKDQVKITDEPVINEANEAYNKLTEAQKARVSTSNQAKLKEVLQRLTAIKEDLRRVAEVEAMIAVLPEPADITLADEPQVKGAEVALAALTAEQAAMMDLVLKAKLDAARVRIVEWQGHKAEADKVIKLIQELPELASIKLSDEEQVNGAKAAFEALTLEQQSFVNATYQQKLQDAVDRILKWKNDKIQADAVSALILGLPEVNDVTLEDANDVDAANGAFHLLTVEQKSLVLEVHQAKLTALVNEIRDWRANKHIADGVAAQLEALPADIKLEHEKDVAAARDAYAALTARQKALVHPASVAKLEAALSRINQWQQDKVVADGMTARIKALPDPSVIVIEDEASVNEVKAAFDQLTPDQQSLVQPSEQNKLNALMNWISKYYDDKAKAEAVSALIQDLPAPEALVLSDGVRVDAAEAAFNQLTADQQQLVSDTHQQKLQAATAAIKLWREDEATANLVIAKIAAIPDELKPQDEAAILEAKAEYDALTIRQKSLVTNASKLNHAIIQIEVVKENHAKAEQVTALIQLLPDPTALTVGDKAKVDEAETAFQALNDNQKALVSTDDQRKLNDAVAKIKELTVPYAITSLAVTNLHFENTYATQAKGESKAITTTEFSKNPLHFTVSDGTHTIPINLNWDIPLNGFTKAQVVGSAVESYIQDYFYRIGQLETRTLAAYSFSGDTFFISTFSTGANAAVRLGGNYQALFDNHEFVGTDAVTRSRSFTVSDGTKTASIVLNRTFSSLTELVSYINTRLQSAAVPATAEMVDDTHFMLKANAIGVKLTVDGANKNEFFGN
ncbi:S-layer homology domain-containing protein [Paenibacillus sp. 1001270B_150601_E10]|uniref:S-layer homology domain-containing protein n=1 Tax=Paenibacillus sp. 1001270B_150601_E10 TaxID=2787079 RepID=UPI00189D843B|nr:S-layer homology domain-containing protein [Paenibacillus sp. 1001270B_150601_E10]